MTTVETLADSATIPVSHRARRVHDSKAALSRKWGVAHLYPTRICWFYAVRGSGIANATRQLVTTRHLKRREHRLRLA